MKYLKVFFFFALCSNFALSARPFYNNKNQQEALDMRPDKALDLASVPAGYNIAGRVNTTGVDCSLEGSFLWWHISQEYMDVARSASFAANAVSDPLPFAEVAVHKFDYQPGFQVALGFGSDFDDWVFKAIYTRIHEESTSIVGKVPSVVNTGDVIWVLNEWFVNLSTGTQQEMVRVKSSWNYDFDMLDFTLGRPLYEGYRLVLSPYAGFRLLWLDQRFNIEGVNANSLAVSPVTSANKSNAWSVGIAAGSAMNWLLGAGVSLDFDFDMSLLYMRYSDLDHNENVQNTVTGQAAVNGGYPDNGSLRPTLKTGAGFSWGTYFCDKDFHFDIACKYDFMILPYQNMMRGTVGYLANNAIGYSNPLGSLFMHGLTATARFDF